MKPSRLRWIFWRMMPGAAVLCSLLCGCSWIEEFPNPASVFEATFNSPPGPGVTVLQAEGRAFRDSAMAYLRLKASPTAFAALTSAGFLPITAREFDTKTQSGSICGPTPSWWAPLKDSPTVFLYATKFHPGYSQGQAIAAYDPTTQIVNFYWDGVD